jgi:hypothetical protein
MNLPAKLLREPVKLLKGEVSMKIAGYKVAGFLFLCCFTMAGAAAGAQERQAILLQGNAWVRGIPGFGPHVPALFGEYRLEFPGDDAAENVPAEESGERRCLVWLTGETLSFAGEDWQSRPPLAGAAVRERRDGDARFFVLSFNGGENLGSWSAVFQFPRGIEAAGLNDAGAGALIGRWLNRFLYFLSLIKNPADVSLPAALPF